MSTISELSNEELLDKMIYLYEISQDYLYQSDNVSWSQEAENDAFDNYYQVKHEVLRRMGEE